MLFSRSCEYGIRAVIYLAGRSPDQGARPIAEIAEAIQSPVAFSSKILQRLVRHQIVQSHRGKSGGFFIDPARLSTLVLRDIVEAMEGEAFFQQCILGLKQCSEKNPCPLHDQFKAHRMQFQQLLKNTTLQHLLVSYQNGASCLRIPESTAYHTEHETTNPL